MSMIIGNASQVDTTLREVFSVQSDYSELRSQPSITWAGEIDEIVDVSAQVIEVRLADSDASLANQAGRAIFGLAGADLPGLLGIQVATPDGHVLARVKRAEIMLLNVPLGEGRVEGW
jgi:hypothetical protein